MPGNIRLYGTTGYVELAAPATGSNTTLTLPTDSIQPGLVLIASQTISTAASVSFNNCFTSAYDNYRVIIRTTSASADSGMFMRLRVGGSDNSTSNYNDQRFVMYNASTVAARNTGATNFRTGWCANTGAAFSIDIHSPALSVNTSYLSTATSYATTPEIYSDAGTFSSTTVFDGCTFFPGSGTITGGTIRIYGYRNS